MFARKTSIIVATLLISTAVTSLPALIAQAQPTPPVVTLPPGAAGLAINPPANAPPVVVPPLVAPPAVVQAPPVVTPPPGNRQIGI